MYELINATIIGIATTMIVVALSIYACLLVATVETVKRITGDTKSDIKLKWSNGDCLPSGKCICISIILGSICGILTALWSSQNGLCKDLDSERLRNYLEYIIYIAFPLLMLSATGVFIWVIRIAKNKTNSKTIQ